MLSFHAIGDWTGAQVRATTIASGRRLVPEVQRIIEQSWGTALRRPGVKLFDGPMCRLESWRASEDRLDLTLSPTSYKPFLGTNLMHPELAERYGRDVMANPVGVSPALLTADDYLLLGRRNASVAYYPGRTHPFAGALEPRDHGNLFAALRRELAEELSLTDADISEMSCTGIVEDIALRQPELIFRARCRRTRRQIELQVHKDEHGDSVAIAATPTALAAALEDPALTPVGIASLLLWGRHAFGAAWFKERAARFSLAPAPPSAGAR